MNKHFNPPTQARHSIPGSATPSPDCKKFLARARAWLLTHRDYKKCQQLQHLVAMMRRAPPEARLYLADFFNEPAVKSTKIGTKKPNKINGHFSPISNAPPLGLVGNGSHQFHGAATATRRARIAAIIDAELGTPDIREPIVSKDGVVTYRVPRPSRGVR